MASQAEYASSIPVIGSRFDQRQRRFGHWPVPPIPCACRRGKWGPGATFRARAALANTPQRDNGERLRLQNAETTGIPERITKAFDPNKSSSAPVGSPWVAT
jgi:hypothetical protein